MKISICRSSVFTGERVCTIRYGSGHRTFWKGTDNGVDVILMIVEPSYESVRLTHKIYELGKSIHKPVFLILNKVTDANRDFMVSNVCRDAAVIGILPEEKSIGLTGLKGSELTEKYLPLHEVALYLETHKTRLMDFEIADLR